MHGKVLINMQKIFLISSNGFEIKSKNSGLNAKVKISSEFQLLKDDLNKSLSNCLCCR